MSAFREVFSVDSVYKLDVRTGSTICRRRESYTVSEGIFVPRAGSDEEDDGIIIHQWLSLLPENNPKLTFLNASNLALIAELEFPVNLPVGIHGMVFHISDNEPEGETEIEPELPEAPGDNAINIIPSIFILSVILFL